MADKNVLSIKDVTHTYNDGQREVKVLKSKCRVRG